MSPNFGSLSVDYRWFLRQIFGDLNLAGDLFVSLLGTHSLGLNQQYLIGDIGGGLTGQFSGLGEGDLIGVFGGQQLFITYAAGNGNDIGLFTAVPEPNALFMFALAGSVLALRRRRVASVATVIEVAELN